MGTVTVYGYDDNGQLATIGYPDGVMVTLNMTAMETSQK